MAIILCLEVSKFEIGSQKLYSYMVPLIRFSVVNMGLSEHVSVFSQEILESRRACICELSIELRVIFFMENDWFPPADFVGR